MWAIFKTCVKIAKNAKNRGKKDLNFFCNKIVFFLVWAIFKTCHFDMRLFCWGEGQKIAFGGRAIFKTCHVLLASSWAYFFKIWNLWMNKYLFICKFQVLKKLAFLAIFNKNLKKTCPFATIFLPFFGKFLKLQIHVLKTCHFDGDCLKTSLFFKILILFFLVKNIFEIIAFLGKFLN